MFRTKDLLKERLEKAYEVENKIDEMFSKITAIVGMGLAIFIVIFGIIYKISGIDFIGDMAIYCIYCDLLTIPALTTVRMVILSVNSIKQDKIREMLIDVLKIEDEEG
jgi:hypothetical protein